MKKNRVLLIWVLSSVLLALVPDWLPSAPPGGWRAWWSWALADPQRGFVFAAGCLAMLIAAWLFLLTSLMLSAAVRDPSGRAVRRTVDWLTPRFARGLVRALLGAAVAVGPGAPALAAGSGSVSVTAATPGLSPVPAPIVAAPELPLLELDRPGSGAASPAPAPTASPPPRQQRQRPAPTSTALPSSTERPSHPARPTPRDVPQVAAPTHEVRPGDTLWALAAAQLPAGSSPAVITRDWQHWYEVNRGEIGVDPDLLLVGERLVIPQETT